MTRDEMAFRFYLAIDKNLLKESNEDLKFYAEQCYQVVDIFFACPLRTKVSSASVSPDAAESHVATPLPSATVTPVPAADNSGRFLLKNGIKHTVIPNNTNQNIGKIR